MESTVQLKKMRCEFGYLSRPDGSAVFASGNSMVLAAVYGPCEVKPQKMMIDKATVEVFYKPKSGAPSIADKLKESMLNNVCKSAILSSEYPRTSISIIVQEMQSSGTLLSSSVNAACLALMDAGVPLKFLVAAVTCIVNSQDELVLDPDEREMKDYKAIFTIVFDGVDKNVVASKIEGEFTKEQFDLALEFCREASLSIFKFYREVVRKAAHSIVST
ncbi:UNVERIFIED_CONTAM: hypothetical protein PYX00_005617 [Menopon gallinae]|uniref:Exosome complex component RRP46 n=1 Tax=Menopon gallinae TaxID=328185 RepID=A0AAW2HTY4_9NEOP